MIALIRANVIRSIMASRASQPELPERRVRTREDFVRSRNGKHAIDTAADRKSFAFERCSICFPRCKLGAEFLSIGCKRDALPSTLLAPTRCRARAALSPPHRPCNPNSAMHAISHHGEALREFGRSKEGAAGPRA